MRARSPSALPSHDPGFHVARGLAMIGAIVGVFFRGTTETLGVQIYSSTQIFEFEKAWAAIGVASILGISFYAAVALAERLALRWHPSTSGGRQE